PVSILATLGVMFLMGQTLNLISMFALLMTLGIIVDDAIVVGEHTATRYAMGDTRQVAAIRGAGRMAIPVIAASLTTIAAFGPILVVGDTVGQIMAALPLVVIAVLISSGVECFFVLPGHLAHSLPAKRRPPGRFRRGFDAGFGWFRDHLFGRLVAISYRWRYATVALAIAVTMVGAGLILSDNLKFTFFPTAEGEQFNIYANFQPGTSPEQMQSIFPDIEKAIGAAETELAPAGEKLVVTTYADLDQNANRASIDVYLTSSEERSVRTSALMKAVRERLPHPAEVENIDVREPRSGPGGRAIEVAFSGADTATLKQAAQELQGILGGFSGVTAISDTLSYGDPELTMKLTPRGRALGFTLDSLGVQIRDALEGREVARLATSEDEITIVLRQALKGTGSAALRELWVRSLQGSFVPLTSVVTFGERRSFSRILREEGKSTVTVKADVEEGTKGADVLARLKADYLPALSARYGVNFTFGGTEKETQAAFADLQLGALVALGVMYVIISWTFASWAAPLAVMLIIPFGIVGAIWG
ncbi:MAG TPA: efflux RND transporter permease subunit, partial [Devosia sp.]|nr:efflux RND transporter permease subunit [Devosia sp.]